MCCCVCRAQSRDVSGTYMQSGLVGGAEDPGLEVDGRAVPW